MSEGVIRFAAFGGIFLAMALLELAIPRRDLSQPRARRWTTNLLIAGVDTLIVRLMGMLAVPLVALAAALFAEQQGWGLFNLIDAPIWIEWLAAIVLLDLAIYAQHVASHKIPLLWRLHKVHHSDVDIDVTTAIRFHPAEIALSMLYKIVLVLALGPAAGAVVLFEILLNGAAMFNHANLALPRWLDRLLRMFLVTPDMHRIHHSIIERETDSNYGFSLSFWDRAFGTYNETPEGGHTGMTIGLREYQDVRPTRFAWAVLLPFRNSRRGNAEKKDAG
ncbi:MAG: sterol desaturase family protein [Pseudomonadota bacterium]